MRSQIIVIQNAPLPTVFVPGETPEEREARHRAIRDDIDRQAKEAYDREHPFSPSGEGWGADVDQSVYDDAMRKSDEEVANEARQEEEAARQRELRADRARQQELLREIAEMQREVAELEFEKQQAEQNQAQASQTPAPSQAPVPH